MSASLSREAGPQGQHDRDDGLAGEVEALLGGRPRRLPSHALYDALGSALFDAICQLPWYPITRAETELLRVHRRSILGQAGVGARIVELGPGSGEKLATLLDDEHGGEVSSIATRAPRGPGRDVHLVDVSAAALASATALLRRIHGTQVHAHTARYVDGLREVAHLRAPGEALLVAFLGSNIGNFDPPEARQLLLEVRQAMRRGDTLLIGADLVKPVEQLQLAYDDPLGVTAAFNRNLLVRLNRELGADFELTRFAHEARWHPGAGRMEMHLVSLVPQHVRVPAARLAIDFQAGETIWTESSYKYDPAAFTGGLRNAGFSPLAAWQDERAGFLLTHAAAM